MSHLVVRKQVWLTSYSRFGETSFGCDASEVKYACSREPPLPVWGAIPALSMKKRSSGRLSGRVYPLTREEASGPPSRVWC